MTTPVKSNKTPDDLEKTPVKDEVVPDNYTEQYRDCEVAPDSECSGAVSFHSDDGGFRGSVKTCPVHIPQGRDGI